MMKGVSFWIEKSNVFITGMARGVDIWVAQIMLMLRNEG